MDKRVSIRLGPPAPVRVTVGRGLSWTLQWNTNKLVGVLRDELEVWADEVYPELELTVVESRQAGIRFEGWKPDESFVLEFRRAIGERLGLVLKRIEPDDYLRYL